MTTDTLMKHLVAFSYLLRFATCTRVGDQCNIRLHVIQRREHLPSNKLITLWALT